MRRIVNFGLLLLACTLVFDAACPQAALAKKRKSAEATEASHRFFSFEDAPYMTSPDMRIGAKMLIDPARVGPSLAAMQHLTFLPQAHVPSHRHVFGIEVLYILKGNLTVRIDQEIKVMGPNTTAFIPQQTFHEYMNKSAEPCEFLQYFSPSGPEEEYRAWQKANEEPAVAEPQAKVATVPQHIVREARSAIPGSPDTRVDRDIREADDSSPAAAPGGTQADKLPDLKLRSDSPSQSPGAAPTPKTAVTLTPPTPSTHAVDTQKIGQALSAISTTPEGTASETAAAKKTGSQKNAKKSGKNATSSKAGKGN